jgi:hypothetical protein
MNGRETLQKTLEAIRMRPHEPYTYRDVQIRLSDVESAKNQRAIELNTKLVCFQPMSCPWFLFLIFMYRQLEILSKCSWIIFKWR